MQRKMLSANNAKIVLRKASLFDLQMLKHWDEQQHVIDSDPNDDWNWEFELTREPEWREQLIAELNGEPIGFVQITDPAKEESHYWGEIDEYFRAIDIWIGEVNDTGRGYGTIIMNIAIDRCFANSHVKAILIDPLTSNNRAHKFYERLGFRFVERRRFGNDECFVYRLERDNWKSSSVQ